MYMLAKGRDRVTTARAFSPNDKVIAQVLERYQSQAGGWEIHTHRLQYSYEVPGISEVPAGVRASPTKQLIPPNLHDFALGTIVPVPIGRDSPCMLAEIIANLYVVHPVFAAK